MAFEGLDSNNKLPLGEVIPVVGSVASGIFKGISGLGQAAEAERLRKEAQAKIDANPYRTPSEILSAEEQASILATQTDLPGMAELEAGFSGATGSAVESLKETARTPGELSEGVINAYESLYVNPLREARIAGAQRQDTNIARAIAAKNVVAQFREKEYEENIKNPYLRAISAADRLSASGLQNQYGSIGDLTGAATAGAELFRRPDFGQVDPVTRRDPITKPIENRYSSNNLITL